MRKTIASLAMVVIASTANASVTAYEPFNYALGTFPNNTPASGIGFTGNWTVANTPSIVAGLTYPNLPTTANAYQHSATAGRTKVNFATPISSGTEYVSFLFKGSGNTGGDTVGIFLPGDNASSLFVGFHSPFSASQTGFGLGSVSSTSLSGATGLGSAINISNTATNFIVLRIDFNTSGANDTVSLWINPPAGTNDPGVAANVTVNSFDVGNISGFGINIQGGYNPNIDELRLGTTYGDVVGANVSAPSPTNQTTIAISPNIGKQVSWTAYNTNSYQVQKSIDNSTWTNFGALIAGTNVTSVYDTAFLPYYQVLEITPGGPGPDVIANGSFEIPAANSSGATNWSSSANTTFESVWVTNQWGALTPVDGANLLYMEGTTAAVSPTAPNTFLLSDQFPVTGGLSYNVKFSAANPVQVGGANPQFRVRFYDAQHAFLTEQFRSFASAGNAWTQFSVTNAAPANAAFMELFFIQAVGAGASWDWVTLIDNISVNATSTFGPVNVLSPTVKSGVSFTATVETNGVPATGATGTVTFQTNSVQLSANGVSFGSGNSANAILLPPYTVTAIYSGDSSYIGSTNTLVVGTTAVTVTLSNLNQTFDGTPKSATATTSPAGFTVALTYNGSATAPTPAGTYQVIGTVVDNDYHGSATNNLVIASTISNTPTNITATVSDGQFTVSWPSDHVGWILQSNVNLSLPSNWFDLPGSEAGSNWVINIDPTSPSVFFRLRSP